MRRFILLICFLLSVANAADGLSVYTDPDFPNFSFEYDPSLWSLELQVFNPVTSRNLKLVTAKNQNGEQRIFSLEYPIETGFDECNQKFRENQITFVGNVAVRLAEDTTYSVQSTFTSCVSNFKQCQKIVADAQLSPLENDIVAVGCDVPFLKSQHLKILWRV
jgi:hypothetical protein